MKFLRSFSKMTYLTNFETILSFELFIIFIVMTSKHLKWFCWSSFWCKRIKLAWIILSINWTNFKYVNFKLLWFIPCILNSHFCYSFLFFVQRIWTIWLLFIHLTDSHFFFQIQFNILNTISFFIIKIKRFLKLIIENHWFFQI